LKRFVGVVGLMLLLVPVVAAPRGRLPSVHAATQPNIVVILTDDQRWDELENMPNVRTLLAQRGVEFTNAFEPNSLCCPSRTTILSGQFSNHTGVWNNSSPNGGFHAFIPHENQTVAVWLHNAGYRTGLVGKYLNQFTVNAAKSQTNPTGLLARPGWDYWTSFDNGTQGGSEPPAYYDYQVDLGATQTTPGTLTTFGDQAHPDQACATFGTCYSTTVLGDQATSFINASPTSQPFFLYFAPYGPHSPFTPAPPDVNALADCTAGQQPPGCYQPETIKPAGQCPLQNGLPPFCSENVGRTGANEVSWVRALKATGTGFNTGNRKRQEQTLLEVDRQVANIVGAVAARGQLADTAFIFTSDNSLSGGSHRWSPKETPWDEALHDPFIVRYDPVTGALAGTVEPRVVLNADIAPTALALAGVPDPNGYLFDGEVIPTFNPTYSRTEFPLEHLATGSNPPTYCGVRTTADYDNAGVTGAWKYVRYQNLPHTGYPAYEQELYDLNIDPFEMNNLAGNPALDSTLATLRRDTQALCSPTPPGYAFTTGAAPRVDGFSPLAGQAGQSVSVTGSGFTGATKVSFNGTSQTAFTLSSDSSITASVPAGAAGTGPICVTNNAGTGCSADSFTVTSGGGSVQHIRLIGTAATSSTSSPTSLAVSVGAGGVPVGDTVVLSVAATGSLVVSAKDAAANAYQAIENPYGGTGPCTSAILTSTLTHPLTAGQKITVSLSRSSGAWGFDSDQWRGLTGGVDRSGTAASNGTSSTTPSVSVAAPTADTDEAVIAATCTTANPTISAGSGFTPGAMLSIVGATNKRGLGSEYTTVSGSASPTAGFSLSSAQNWSAVIATYP
jgi:N-acetylglucosamine-6-sulfatase